MSQVQSIVQKANVAARAGVTTHDDPTNKSAAQSTHSYPRTGLQSRNPAADQRLRTKMQLSKSGESPFGKIYASDADFALLEEKRKQEEEANFDRWVGTHYHTGDVAQRAWLQQTVPGYYDVREKEIDDRAEFAKMVAKIDLRGPQTTEEMILVYGLMEGKIQLQPGWNVIGYRETTQDKKERQNRFLSGLFGPYRWQSPDDRKKNAALADNPFRNEKLMDELGPITNDADADLTTLMGRFKDLGLGK